MNKHSKLRQAAALVVAAEWGVAAGMFLAMKLAEKREQAARKLISPDFARTLAEFSKDLSEKLLNGIDLDAIEDELDETDDVLDTNIALETVAFINGKPVMGDLCWRCYRDVDLTNMDGFELHPVKGDGRYGYEPTCRKCINAMLLTTFCSNEQDEPRPYTTTAGFDDITDLAD